MSDRFDQQIRDLFTELDAVAPAPPALPQIPARRPVPGWVRGISVASGVAIVVLVVGIASQLLFTGAEDSAPDIIGAPATTQAAAETTLAPVTSAAEAADSTGAPAETRPPDQVLVLAELNLACNAFIQDSAQVVPTAPATDQEYIDAATLLQPVYLELSIVILDQESNLDEEVIQLTEMVSADMSDLATGNQTVTWADLVLHLGDLAAALERNGALDCAGLTNGLP